MNVREQLNGLMRLDRLIDCKVAQYDRARKFPAPDLSANKLRAMAEEINTDIDRLVDEKKAIMNMVDNTPDLTPDELEVLYKHYLEGQTFEAIAKQKHYAKASIFRICTKATNKVIRHWENT